MVFKIAARLYFATAADRTAAQTTINSAVSGRNTTIRTNDDSVFLGKFAKSWEAEEADTGDAGTIYALMQAMTTPLPGSVVQHHTCFDDQAGPAIPCQNTARKAW